MEARQNVWYLWYLMTLDKPNKVECKFYNNVISYHKDIMLSIWAINMMAMKEFMLSCVWRHKHKSKHYLPHVGKLSLNH